MSGLKAPYVPGWDTHGLPIELQAVKKLKLNRDRKSAGEVIGEGDDAIAIEHDCYITDVVGVTLSDRALRQLDAATAL